MEVQMPVYQRLFNACRSSAGGYLSAYNKERLEI